jgi:type I restriction-modification system DNA methylase subunit
VLDWTAQALNRVDRETFFTKFEEEHAVQYFYEPFLAAFDPELRKELGVWYTPIEVVRYMVERVDRALRDDLAGCGKRVVLEA